MSTRRPLSEANPATIADILLTRAERQPDREAYSFLANGLAETRTFAMLDRRARAVARELQEHHAPGERALLLYPSGFDFLEAFFGCVYAGVIAVPVAWSRPRKAVERLSRIAADSQARFVLTTSTIRADFTSVRHQDDGMALLSWVATDGIDTAGAGQWRGPAVDEHALAFLQYTSGSTLEPRGVRVTHANLMHNQRLLQHAFGQREDSVIVTWLPLFHDMGLVGAALHALYVGALCVLMSPQAFLQKPIRWLEAISRYRATASGGPNFAFDLCAQRVTPEMKRTLDLRSWTVAFNGAEPVRWHTIERFAAAFRGCGFSREAFHPCYGLAESTLLVRAGSVGSSGSPFAVDELALGRGQAIRAEQEQTPQVQLTSVGSRGAHVEVVNPESRAVCEPGVVGEIWVCGPSVADGYWGRPEAADEQFRARTANSDGRTYLRTGDFGFHLDGELYVTGRMKDVVIVGGVNYYPQEIELTTEQSHAGIRPGCTAAFSIDIDRSERLVVVCEVGRDVRSERSGEVVDRICRAVAADHGLEVAVVVLVGPEGVPKGSSGKVQRGRCRQAFLDGRLGAIHEWRRAGAIAASREEAGAADADIRAWLLRRLGEEVGVHPDALDPQQPLATYGLTSIRAVGLSGEIADRLGRQLPPTLFYDYPTIDRLAEHLTDGTSSDSSFDPVPDERALRDAGRAGTKGLAIVGFACRFPGADTPEALWDLLSSGRDALEEVPASRWDRSAFYDANPESAGKIYSQRGGFLRDVESFDPEFFGIAAREARSLDPQQRLLLELTHEALERSGLSLDARTASRTGVFIGICGSDYSRYHVHSGDAARIDAYSFSGMSSSFAAGRISYTLGLQGPALAVDTACSSSLAAVHLASQSLRSGECDVAIVGGVNLMLFPEASVCFSRARALSPRGRCRTFDAGADGYVRSEGCAVVILKRCQDAEAHRNRIHAVLAGTALNQDGRSNGLTAPNRLAQERLLRSALADADIESWQVACVEAHGTGTALGDPIELGALQTVLCQRRPAHQPLVVGSIKSHIGHTEAAAGLAGLIKAVLILEHREVPPQINFETPNPSVPWHDVPIHIPREATPLVASPDGLFVGVSSFGLSGTNAHVILKAAVERPHAPAVPDRPLHVLTLSAKSVEARAALAARYAAFLDTHDGISIADVCFTANTGRPAMEHRLAVVGGSAREMSEALHAYANGQSATGARIFAGSSRGSSRPDPSSVRGSDAKHLDEAPTTLAESYVSGLPVDWEAFDRGYPRRRVVLPTYPFAKRRVWYEQPAPTAARETAFVGERRYSPLHDKVVFETHLSSRGADFSGHRIRGSVIVPGAGLISMVLSGAAEAFGASSFVLDDIVFSQPVALPDGVTRCVQLILSPAGIDAARFEIVSAGDDATQWVSHATGNVAWSGAPSEAPRLDIDEARARCGEAFTGDALNEALSHAGFSLDGSFRWQERIWRRPGEAVGQLRAASHGDRVERYLLHPGLLDSLFQLVRALFPMEGGDTEGTPYVPVAIERFEFSGGAGHGLSYAAIRGGLPQTPPETFTADLRMHGQHGAAGVVVRGLVLKRAHALRSPAVRHLRQLDWLESARGTPSPSRRSTARRVAVLSPAASTAGAMEPQLTVRGIDATVLCSIAELRDQLNGGTFDAVIDARGAMSAVIGGAEPIASMRARCADALGVMQLMASLRPASTSVSPPRLWMAVRGIGPGPDAVDPGSWPLWGMASTFAIEHPAVWGGLVDAGSSPIDEAIAAIAEEAIESDGDDLIAWRAGRRLVARFRALPASVSSTTTGIRGDASYVVTGGLGALGMTTARWLADRGARRIVLLARTARQRAAGSDEVLRLRGRGLDVLALDCDVSSAEQLSAAIASVHERRAPIRGIVHAAGIIDDRLLRDETPAHLAEVMAAKTQGAWNLHVLSLSHDLPLDFFVCYSSLASVTGSPGQSAYAAANAFLDGLAHYRCDLGLPALAINWGPWAHAGMGARLNEGQRRRLQRVGVEFLDREEAVAILDDLLARPTSQVIAYREAGSGAVDPVNAAEQRPLFASLRQGRAGQGRVPARPTHADFIARLGAMNAEQSRAAVEELVARNVSHVLGRDTAADLPTKTPLNALGIDSLMVEELAQALGSAIGQRVPATALFNYPTVDALTGHLWQTLVDSGVARDGAEEDGSAAHRSSEGSPEEHERIASDDAAIDEVLSLSERDLEALVDHEFAEVMRQPGDGSGAAR